MRLTRDSIPDECLELLTDSDIVKLRRWLRSDFEDRVKRLTSDVGRRLARVRFYQRTDIDALYDWRDETARRRCILLIVRKMPGHPVAEAYHRHRRKADREQAIRAIQSI